MNPPTTHTRERPPALDARLDTICRRQQARFLDHLRSTGQASPKLETDVSRFISFVFQDVKTAIREHSKEAQNARTQTH